MSGAFLVAALLAAAPARFALVVGSNRAESGSPASQLRFADDDAVSMHELLLEAGVDSVLLASPDGDTARLHPGTIAFGAPALGMVRAAFESLAARMSAARARGDDVEWIFYFSGHGDVAHGEGYAVLEDGRLTRSMLYDELLARSPASRNHVLVDACKSFFLAYGKGPGGTRQRFGQPFASASARPGNTGFVLSTSSDRDSHEWERIQAGIFSYELRSALRGAADADGDGRVSYVEVGAFLESANAAIASPGHRPDFVVLPPGGEAAALVEPVLSWEGRGLLLDARPGHLFVERRTGERLLDVHPGPELALSVHLPPDRPLFVRSADGASERVLEGPATAFSALPPGEAPTRRKGALHLAFEQLFAEPFEAARVERFRVAYHVPDLTITAEAEPWTTAVRTPALITFAGAAALGGGLTAWAAERRSGAAALSQEDRARRNQAITALNAGAIAAYAIAAAAGVTWLTATLLEAPLVVAPAEDGVVVAGRF